MAQRTPGPAKGSAAKAFNTFNMAKFVVGAKASNTINVGVTLKDALGQAVAGICNAFVYLSANPDGSTLTGVQPTSTTAVGTNGVILGTHTNLTAFDLISNAAGLFDLNIIQTAGGTLYYLVVCMPDGSIAVSPAIQF